MREFLDESSNRFNREWGQIGPAVEENCRHFILTIEVLEEVFGERGIARKHGSNLFNRSIFDVLAYYASEERILQRMREHPKEVLRAYAETIADEGFQIAVESDTAGIPHTEARLRIWGEKLSAALNMPVPIPRTELNAQGQFRFVE
jgi:hypothetical protein